MVNFGCDSSDDDERMRLFDCTDNYTDAELKK